MSNWEESFERERLWKKDTFNEKGYEIEDIVGRVEREAYVLIKHFSLKKSGFGNVRNQDWKKFNKGPKRGWKSVLVKSKMGLVTKTKIEDFLVSGWETKRGDVSFFQRYLW